MTPAQSDREPEPFSVEAWGYREPKCRSLPWYLRLRTAGCWLWLLVWSVLGGVLADSLFFLLTVTLFVAALAVLARDPNEP